MRAHRIRTRIDLLEHRVAPARDRFVVISPDTWPPDISDAYDQAVRDDDGRVQARIIEERTGEKLRWETTRIIALRVANVGPD